VSTSNSQTDENIDWNGMSSLLAWIRENTPSDSVLLGNLDPIIYLYTGRKSVRGFFADPYLLYYSDNSDESIGIELDLLGVLITQKVNYIIRTPAESFKEVPIFNRMLDRMLLKDEKIFRLVKESSFPGYKVYWVNQQLLQQKLQGGSMHVITK